MVTRTAQGIPGDPINVGLIGDRDDIVCAMHTAGWSPAAAISLRSSIGIAGSVIFRRPYRSAPVSNLFYLGRREDLAFEKQVGSSADQRHHVRLWKVLERGSEDRPVWLGDATFDRGVGISHYTGAITHHIAPDIDAERGQFAADLESAGMVTAKYQVTGVGPTLAGRNGGGDPYYTDGEVWDLAAGRTLQKAFGAGRGTAQSARDPDQGRTLAQHRPGIDEMTLCKQGSWQSNALQIAGYSISLATDARPSGRNRDT